MMPKCFDFSSLLVLAGGLLLSDASSNASCPAIQNHDLVHEGGYFGHKTKVLSMLSCGANIEAKNKKDKKTALVSAGSNGHLDIVNALLENRADIEAREVDGSTTLVNAGYHGHLELTNTLLQQRAKADAADKDGYTALIWAGKHGHLDVVNDLLEHRANVEAATKMGITALMMAGIKGHLEVVNALLENQADINHKNKFGQIAVDLAGGDYGDEIIQVLLHLATTTTTTTTTKAVNVTDGNSTVSAEVTQVAEPTKIWKVVLILAVLVSVVLCCFLPKKKAGNQKALRKMRSEVAKLWNNCPKKIFLSHTGRTSSLALAIKGSILSKAPQGTKIWSMEDIPVGAGSSEEEKFNTQIVNQMDECDIVVGILDASCKDSHPKWGCPAEWAMGLEKGKQVLIFYLEDGTGELESARTSEQVREIGKQVQMFPLSCGPHPNSHQVKLIESVVKAEVIPKLSP